jgi:hypothetical protein
MKKRIKKLGIAILGLAFFFMASISNQAKAFTVNDTDLYLILSNNTTEAYVDLGLQSTVLSSGLPSTDISSFVTSAAGASDIHWTLVSGNLGTGDMFFTDSNKTMNGSSVGVQVINGLTQWGSFQVNSGAGSSMTLAASNANSYFNLFDGAGFNTGTLGQTVSANEVNGTVNRTGSTNSVMNLYQGNFSDNILNLLSMVATVTGSAAAGYTLTIAAPSAVPVPPSVVMFVTGLIALAVIARRKEASV